MRGIGSVRERAQEPRKADICIVRHAVIRLKGYCASHLLQCTYKKDQLGLPEPGAMDRGHAQLKSYRGIGIAPGRRQFVVLVGTSKVALSQAMLDILNWFKLSTMPSTAVLAYSSAIFARLVVERLDRAMSTPHMALEERMGMQVCEPFPMAEERNNINESLLIGASRAIVSRR